MDTKFDYVEYLAFILMLCASVAIGVYYGCFKGGQNTVSGYLLGGKQMSVFPIIMSLVSTNISGVTLLGVPTEIYVYGPNFLLIVIPILIALLINVIAVLPVFYKLQFISLYEYLEMRFSNSLRLIMSFMYVILVLTVVTTVIYGPALALNQVSGMNVHLVTPIVSIICIIYTTLGGLKAVVWSDTLQATVMLGSVLTVMVLGVRDVGGISKVFESAAEGDRLDFFNMDANPTTRLSFWSATVGVFFLMSLTYCCSASSVQRYISLPTLKHARYSSLGLALGATVFLWLSGFIGLIIYARYKDCNPLATTLINRPDQILPLFVKDVASNVRGLSGIFMAGIVFAALSTLSTVLNTLSGIIYEDFIEPLLPTKPNERKASLILKFIVLVTGAIAVSLVFLIEKLGQIVEVAQGFGGMLAGTMQGVFILGLFFPCANTAGALSGGLISFVIMTWLMTGNIIANSNGLIRHAVKPMSTAMCPSNITRTIQTHAVSYDAVKYFPLYNVSVFYYSLIGCVIVLIIGLPVSLLTGSNKHKQLDVNLLSPLVVRFCNVKNRYTSVQLTTVSS